VIVARIVKVDFTDMSRKACRGHPHGPTAKGDYTREATRYACHAKRQLMAQGIKYRVNAEATTQTIEYLVSKGWKIEGGRGNGTLWSVIYNNLKNGR
jgi:hypothetical protein